MLSFSSWVKPNTSKACCYRKEGPLNFRLADVLASRDCFKLLEGLIRERRYKFFRPYIFLGSFIVSVLKFYRKRKSAIFIGKFCNLMMPYYCLSRFKFRNGIMGKAMIPNHSSISLSILINLHVRAGVRIKTKTAQTLPTRRTTDIINYRSFVRGSCMRK